MHSQATAALLLAGYAYRPRNQVAALAARSPLVNLIKASPNGGGLV